MISLEMLGLKEAMAKFGKAADGDWIDESIKDTANDAVKYAREYCPRDTEALHDSIEVVPLNDGFELTAGNSDTINRSGIDYTIFQEFFSSPFTAVGAVGSPIAAVDTQGHIAFRPFLRPALIRARNEAMENFGKKWYRIVQI